MALRSDGVRLAYDGHGIGYGSMRLPSGRTPRVSNRFDLIVTPSAESGFFVRRQVIADEIAERGGGPFLSAREEHAINERAVGANRRVAIAAADRRHHVASAPYRIARGFGGLRLIERGQLLSRHVPHRFARQRQHIGGKVPQFGLVAASTNDGIGVPFIPVRKRRYTSCGVAPPRNVHGSVRLVAGSGRPASSFRSVAIAPVPLSVRSVACRAAQLLVDRFAGGGRLRRRRARDGGRHGRNALRTFGGEAR